MKRKKLSVVLLFILSFGTLNAQSIYVNENNGTQKGYALNNIKSINFTAGNMNVVSMTNNSDSYAIVDLSSLTFIEETIDIQEQLSNNDIFIYPNPVADLLNINTTNSEELIKGKITILDVNGQVVKSEKVNNQKIAVINVSNLSQGIYLCKYSNNKETKTVKFIKK